MWLRNKPKNLKNPDRFRVVLGRPGGPGGPDWIGVFKSRAKQFSESVLSSLNTKEF